jgi:hypothetical protein
MDVPSKIKIGIKKAHRRELNYWDIYLLGKLSTIRKTRCATKNDRIRVLDDNLMVLISESLANQDQKTSCTSRRKIKFIQQ